MRRFASSATGGIGLLRRGLIYYEQRKRDASPLPLKKSTPKKLRKSRSRGAITLREVAKLAGVAPMTVSRALNNPELVTASTLEAVQATIQRTGYVPNLLAGGLASQKSRLVAAILPSMGNSIFAEVIESMADRLNEDGYKVLLGLSGYPPDEEENLLLTVLSRKPDAVVLTGINHSPLSRSRLLAAKIPVVETWDFTPTPIDMLVGFSHEQLGRQVAEYLHGKGYRRIGMVWASDDRARLRRQAFIAELSARGVFGVQVATVTPRSTLKKGREGIAEILDGGKPLDAVFCSSDILAQGVLTECQLRGISVPRDLAVIGFGDFEFAAYVTPALTTVQIDRRAIGRLAAEAVLARINGHEVEQIVDVGFRLIERESA